MVELEIKRKALATQRSELSKAQEGFLDKLSKLPPKGMELARLQRDLQVRNAIFLALSQQYESAIINENKESEAFLPLDKAEASDFPSSPNKRRNAIVGLLLGLIVGVSVATYRLISPKLQNG
ncbi:cryptic autophosphorylating protein tyrosine kinase Etk [compost metagenome]